MWLCRPRIMSAALALLASLASPARADAKPQLQGWPLWRHDLGNSGSTVLALPGPVAKPKAWRFRGGSHVWGYQPGMSVWSSAALGVVDKRAVVVAGSYDHNVYCLDALTGEKLWRYTTGGGVYAAPILWRGEGKVPPLVIATSSDRSVYAIEAGLGRRRWIYAVQSWRPTMGGARLSSPALGRVAGAPAVFVGHWVWDKSLRGHLQAGGLTALDARTGQRRWTTPLGDNQLSSPLYLPARASSSVGAGDGAGALVFAASEDGNLYALEAESGQVRWVHHERNVIKASPALFRLDGRWRVLIGSKHGMLRCLDAETGKELWRYKTGHWIDGSAAVATLDGQPVVFVGSYDLHLYALSGRDGKLLWRYRTTGGIYSSPAVLKRGKRAQVLFAAWDHQLHCVDAADGQLRWTTNIGRPLWDAITLGDSVWASPTVGVIGGHALVYFGSYAGPLHAIVLDEAVKQALARPSSNLDFWMTLPLVLLGVALILIVLTRRERRARAARPR